MSNQNWAHDEDDELTAEDREFLAALENDTPVFKGKNRNPDEPPRDDIPIVDPGPSAQSTQSDQSESNQVDESQMDISNTESDEPLADNPRSEERDSDSAEHNQDERDQEPQASPPHSEDDTEEPTPEPPSAEEDKSEAADQDEDHESPQEPSDDLTETYESVPEAGPRCTNHCEDNEEDASDESCPHCDERIRLERMQWGAVAIDRNNEPLLPGDKVLVVVPNPMMNINSLLTINVPNTNIEDPRYLESTGGDIDTESCWLSGKGISSFTGWHMINAFHAPRIGNSVWKFSKGARIGFVEKVGSPKYEDFYPEQLIEDFMKELDQQPTAKEPTESKEEPDEPEHEPQDDLQDKREQREHHRGADMTQAQHDRFDNLAERIDAKVKITFGGTMENHYPGEAIHERDHARQTIKIVSRGVAYYVTIEAQRSDKNKNDKGEAA